MPHNNKNSYGQRSKRIAAIKCVAYGFLIVSLHGCQSARIQSPAVEEVNNFASPSVQTTPQNVIAVSSALNGPWKERIYPLFEQARRLVEQETDTDLSAIQLNIAADQQISNEVSFETNRLVQSQFDNPAFANHFLNSVMAGQAGTYAALYATRRSEVMISQPLLSSYEKSLPKDQGVRDAALLALLIHEFVHAADDQRYNIHESRKLNFRASFAQSAAFEGHAQHVTRKICALNSCLRGLEALDHFMFGPNNPPNKLTQTVQAISRNVLEYSYVEGERFVSKIASRPNGDQLIAQLLSSPPEDPIQILDPDSFPNNNRELQNQQLISASRSFKHPWLQKPWTQVQTSPLKGVNLRADPVRRSAAVDGFTRLITAMVALQLYDQSVPGKSPIELTLMRAESADTADLFAQSLHENTKVPEARAFRDRVQVKVKNTNQAIPIQHFITVEGGDNNTFVTFVARSGNHVVQLAGLTNSTDLYSDYANKLLALLTLQQGKRLARVSGIR